MGKKCIPGVICIENMTLFLLFIVIILMIYFYYTLVIKSNSDSSKKESTETKVVVINNAPSDGLSLNNPPLRMADGYPPLSNRGIPINVETRGTYMNYTQIGILTNSNTLKNESSPLILPLIGRQYMTGRDKWQYYTMSNTGFINTKLPIRVNGKNCSGEYGCDSLMTGDIVYVEGYDNTFRATVYDSAQFSYIPYL
jgi:hypothetical protein